MRRETENKEELQVKRILQHPHMQDFAAPQFYVTRMAAHAIERAELSARETRWRWTAFLSAGGAIVLLILMAVPVLPRLGSGTLQSQSSIGIIEVSAVLSPEGILVEAPSGKAVAVHMEKNAEGSLPFAFAEVALPEGVSFYSEQHPELAHEPTALIDLSSSSGRTFPVVIRATQAGRKSVSVKYLRADKSTAVERTLQISFH